MVGSCAISTPTKRALGWGFCGVGAMEERGESEGERVYWGPEPRDARGGVERREKGSSSWAAAEVEAWGGGSGDAGWWDLREAEGVEE